MPIIAPVLPTSYASGSTDSAERQKIATMMDAAFQAQSLTELGKSFKQGLTVNPAGNVPFFFAQCLVSGFMLFSPKLDFKLKLLHVVLSLYSLTRITLSLYLYFSDETCTTDSKSNNCKVDYALDLFFKGFLLFAIISAKAAKYHEKRILLKRSSINASSLPNGSPTAPAAYRVVFEPNEPIHPSSAEAVPPVTTDGATMLRTP